MKLALKLWFVLVACAIGFGSSYLFFNAGMQAKAEEKRALIKEQLQNKFQLDLENLKRKQAMEISDWEMKIAAENAKADDIQKLWDNRGKIYNEKGDFLLPYNALRFLSVGGFNIRLGDEGRTFYPDPRMEDFFRLTKDEISAIETLIKTTWKALTDVERKYVTVKQDGEKLTVMVQPYFEEGVKVKELFCAGLLEILGSERYEIFMQANYDDRIIRYMFLMFGQVQYKIVFTKWGRKNRCDYLRPDGEWKYAGWEHNLRRFVHFKPDYFKDLVDRY